LEAMRDIKCDFSRSPKAQSRRDWKRVCHACRSVLFVRTFGGSSGVKTSGSGVDDMAACGLFESSRLKTNISSYKYNY
jgi:hypothetical protein